MAFKSCLQLLLVLAFIAPHMISSHTLHIRKPSRFLFPKHLQGSRKGDNLEGIHRVKTYLQHYGYLSKSESSNNNSHADAFDDRLESAVVLYQKFFKLNVSGVLDEGTLDQMSRPRCGVSDIWIPPSSEKNNNGSLDMGGARYRFFPSRRKWPPSKFHLKYGIILNFPPNFVAAMTRAFDTWEGNTKFSFSPAPRIQASDIVISFGRRNHGDRFPFDGPMGILAHAFGPIDGRLHLDADENWAVEPNSEQFDIESITLHELGHILGLGHSGNQAAIMWPEMYKGEPKRFLHPDDLAGIVALYGR